MTRTLQVHIGPPTDRSNLEDALSAIDAGEDVDPRPSRLTVESLDTFNRVFRSTNLELLYAIAEHEPDSIRELARLVDRHPPEVTDNVRELADLGLVELVDEGRAKRPTVWYDEIAVEGDISLREDGADLAPA
jgi:predicted transcriptional regulator